MIDRAFFIVLVLNATGLFSFAAPQLGVSIGQISLVLLGMNAFYLVVKARHSAAILLQNNMVAWMFVLLLWPLLSVVYAPSFELRNVGLQFYLFSLFLGAVVYAAANGLHAMHRVLQISLIITVVGLALSMVAPQYFEAVSELANAAVENEGRPFGFLLQPNSLATALAFLFIGWFALWGRKRIVLELGAILAFLLLMLLTGSRTGIVVSVIVAAFIQMSSWRKELASGKLLLKAAVLIACLIGGAAGMKYYLSQVQYSDTRKADLMDRMETMLSFRLSNEGGIKEDTSVQARRLAQQVYWGLLEERPLLGHGLGANTYYQENGRIFLSAHSEALECAMEYGVLYPIAFVLLMLKMYLKRGRSDVEHALQSNSVGQFVFVATLLFVINGNLLDSRTFNVVLGMFFAAVYCPRYVFGFDEATGRIRDVLTRREIVRRLFGGGRLRDAPATSTRLEVAQVEGGDVCK